MKHFINGLIANNPTYRQLLGLCPTLAVSTTLKNAVGMGLATTIVLIGAGISVSFLRKLIPDKVRIPAYIVIIASFVTVIDLLMNAYFNDLHKVLGIFIPLIVVNCIVLGRAEAFASKHNPVDSAFDALGNGLGFTLGISSLGLVRELLGTGAILGHHIIPADIPMAILFILPPGAFIVLGFLLALFNKIFTKEA